LPVPCSKHILSYKNQSVKDVMGNNHHSEIHKEHINTLCVQNTEILNIKPGGAYNNQWILKI